METPFNKPGRFYKGNLHTHSNLSDGQRTPEQVCRFYADAGYDFISMTDHFIERYRWPLADTREFDTRGFVTIPGAELHPPTHRMEHGREWHLVAVGLPFDFPPPQQHETGPEMAQRALDAGAWVAAAHPNWFAMTENDMLALPQIHAIEIYNASCHDDNDSAESVYMLDYMLARGMRIGACATDDAHFTLNTHDRAAGWTMVKAEANTPEALLAALKRGDVYSSTGPEIIDLQVVPGERLSVRCSPASRVFMIGGPAVYRQIGEAGITEAEFDLSTWASPFVRVLVRDYHGRKAWSNPIWFDTAS